MKEPNSNRKHSAGKIITAVFLIIFLLGNMPVGKVSAEDATNSTPTESPTVTPTAVPTETPAGNTTPESVDLPAAETSTPEISEPALEETPTQEPSPKVNVPPSIQIIEPSTDITATQGETITIKWVDEDPDDNAYIILEISEDSSFNESKKYPLEVREDPDGLSDEYDFSTSDFFPL